ncbi:hypothetical protein OUZ56_017090 [Daphnia magna]|uniref:Uncharacterized protein n=1 Tax=Daphnia magna TaxID=35525 RepID=A0ABR0AS66_9CRUS|nr:hypothetical protein OUZ56_017090 [Daphnia magna]
MLHNFLFDICGLQGAMGYPASAAPTPAPVNYPALPAMPISASSPLTNPPHSISAALPHCQDVDSLGCESNEREVRSQYWRNDRVLGSWFGVTSGRCTLT